MTDDAAATSLQVIICEDDPVVRSVISDLIEAEGHAVLAETDSASGAMSLVDQFEPDLIILDLDLALGSGLDVLDHCRGRDRGPAIIVFTAFEEVSRIRSEGVQVVKKPDMGELERTLRSVGQMRTESDRRSGSSTPVERPSIDDLDPIEEFTKAILAADPADVFLTIFVEGLDEDEAARLLRQTLRQGDWLTRRRSTLIALISGDATAAAERLVSHLEATIPDVAERISSMPIGPAPIDRYMELTQR